MEQVSAWLGYFYAVYLQIDRNNSSLFYRKITEVAVFYLFISISRLVSNYWKETLAQIMQQILANSKFFEEFFNKRIHFLPNF